MLIWNRSITNDDIQKTGHKNLFSKDAYFYLCDFIKTNSRKFLKLYDIFNN